MKVYLIREIQLFYSNKKLRYKIFQLLYPNRLFKKKYGKFNRKKFKYSTFQILKIIEMFCPNIK